MNDDQKPPYVILIFSLIVTVAMMAMMGNLVKALVLIGVILVVIFAFMIWRYGFNRVLGWVLSIFRK